MRKEELKELLKDNFPNEKHNISSAAFLNIGRFVDISLKMDSKTLDYYYEMDADELLSSEMPEEEYNTIKDQGWCIIDNKIIIYLI